MRIDIRTCDDWVAVYKDGRKVEENHSVPLRRGLEALGIEFHHVDLDEQMDPVTLAMPDGSEPFPERLCECKIGLRTPFNCWSCTEGN